MSRFDRLRDVHGDRVPTDGRDPEPFRGHRLFAWAYARLSGAAEQGPLGHARRSLVSHAAGVTVDLGSGTGHNLGHLTERVTDLHLVEPDPHMLRRLHVPAERHGAAVHAVGAEHLPFAAGTVDTVISTLTLCSVQDAPAAAAEIRRVLRPGGQLLLLEHVRSCDPATSRRQDRLDQIWGRMAGGCHINRDTGRLLEAAGLRPVHVRRTELPGPAISREVLVGQWRS